MDPQSGLWQPIGNMNSRVQALVEDERGQLLVGGTFSQSGDIPADAMAAWDLGTGAWSSLTVTSAGSGLDGAVFDVEAGSDGTIIAAGVFTRAGRGTSSMEGIQALGSIGTWDPLAQKWIPLGEGLNNLVKTVAVDAVGGIYAGGYFTASGTEQLGFIGYWTSAGWNPLGTGLNGAVEDMVVGPDGSLYVAGYFSLAGGVSVGSVAVWDPRSSTWSALGTGMNAGVEAIAVSPDGVVYAGGPFTLADERAASGIARWDPAIGHWEPLGLGKNSIVRSIAIAPDGGVFAGGLFTFAGTVVADYVARWDPKASAWSAVGSGLNSAVRVLKVGPDGSLYAGGVFTQAGDVETSFVARWDASTDVWSALGSGTNGSVRGIALDADGRVYLGGFFTSAGGETAAHFAVWSGDVSAATVSVAGSPELPAGVDLEQNYPNPFNPATTIAFSLAEAGHVRLAVYDLLGREVQVLVDAFQESGRHQIRFDAPGLATGSYIYRLDTPEASVARTLTLVR